MMRINRLQQQIRILSQIQEKGEVYIPHHAAHTIAFGESIFDFLALSFQQQIVQMKQQLVNKVFDGAALFADYEKTLQHYCLFSKHDASDILMLYPDRLLLEIYIDYYPKVDFSDILMLDNDFYNLLADNKLAALDCIHRLYRREAIKISHKPYLPLQYHRLKDKCSAYFK